MSRWDNPSVSWNDPNISWNASISILAPETIEMEVDINRPRVLTNVIHLPHVKHVNERFPLNPLYEVFATSEDFRSTKAVTGEVKEWQSRVQ